MPAIIKKKASAKNAAIKMTVGNMQIDVVPVSDSETAKANARIQRKVKPIFNKIKRTRSAASITASKIVLNA